MALRSRADATLDRVACLLSADVAKKHRNRADGAKRRSDALTNACPRMDTASSKRVPGIQVGTSRNFEVLLSNGEGESPVQTGALDACVRQRLYEDDVPAGWRQRDSAGDDVECLLGFVRHRVEDLRGVGPIRNSRRPQRPCEATPR